MGNQQISDISRSRRATTAAFDDVLPALVRPRRRRLLWQAAAVIAVAAIGYGGVVVGGKLIELRYRLQLLEARQESILRIAAARVKREQQAIGPARVSTSEFDFEGSWERFAGPGVVEGWPDDYERSKALGVHDNQLYVGLSKPRNGAPQVWRTNGKGWERIGGEAVPGWGSLREVTAFASHVGKLVAAIDDTVWTYDSGWHRVGGDGTGWPKAAYANAYALAVKGDTLYVGMHGGDAGVFAYSGGQWQKIAGSGIRNSWNDARYQGVYELWLHTDGYLYAGLVANPGPTAIYRYDGERWEKIGGDGVNGSWSYHGFSYALSFASHDGHLVVSMNRHPMIEDNFSSVWSFDGKRWQPVGLGHVPVLWGEMHNYNAVASYRGLLLVGAGGNPGGNASLWAIRDGRPSLVGGRGTRGSWGDAEHDIFDWLDHENNQYVYRLIEWRGDLIVGFGDDPGSAQLWRFRPAGH